MYRFYLTIFRSWKTNLRVNRTTTYSDEKAYLDGLQDFEEPLARAANQYRCHVFVEGYTLHFVLNILSLFYLPLFVFFLFFISLYSNLQLFLFPKRLVDSDVDIRGKKIKGRILKFSDLLLLWKGSLYFFLFPYLFIVSLDVLSKYRYLIFRDNPKKILVSCEYSFSSSVIYKLCEDRGVILCNVMHGEKVFDIIDAFSTFHSFIVWEGYYETLFLKLKVSVNEFQIENPFVGVLMDSSEGSNSVCYYDQGFSLEYLKSVYALFENSELNFYLRLHPIYSKLSDKERKLFNVDSFEYAFDSLSCYEYICSRFSTVLYICVSNGKKVIIDDTSSDFEDLISRYPTFLRYKDKFILLSEFLK